MLERVRAARRSESGFTLTELLITIVILGVLAGIVVFAVNAFTNDGKQVACETDKKNVEVAAEAFRARKGFYPTEATDTLRIGRLVLDGYLREAPASPDYTITLSLAGAVASTYCP